MYINRAKHPKMSESSKEGIAKTSVKTIPLAKEHVRSIKRDVAAQNI